MRILALLLSTSIAAIAHAQSPLTTLFDATNVGGVGGQVFFDLQVNTTITIQGFALNLNSAVGTAGTIDVFTRNGSYLGQELNAAQWSAAPVASGAITSAGIDVPSPVCFTAPLTLQPGLTGFAVRHTGVAAAYTLGNGSVIPGGGGPATNQTFSTAEVTILLGAAQTPPWTASFQPRVANISINYLVGATGLPCSPSPAENVSYGNGCYRFQGSFYDAYTAAGASTLLAGRTLSMIQAGGGYLVLQLPGTSFLAPTPAATTLSGFAPDSDDGDVAVTLPAPFPLVSGTTSTLFVHTNGMVSTGSNHATFTPNSFFPTLAGFLGAPNTAWYCWHDYNPAEVGSGQIKTELVGALFCITWDGVESYPGVPTANPSRFQLQFDLSSGTVNFVWQTITATNAGAASDIHLIGYSPGGPSVDHGFLDITAITTTNTLQLDGALDRLPLALAAGTRPVVGHTVSYTTTNATTNPGLGLNLLSLSDLAPFSPVGLDLVVIGAPGCVANVDLAQGVGNVISNIPGFSLTVQLPIPVNASLAGAQIFSQSVWLDAAANAGGLLTSNAIRTRIGTF
jgi:hypothetical protein